MVDERCASPGCPALVAFYSPDGFCAAHAGVKLVGASFAGATCLRCKRRVQSGEYITRASTHGAVEHAACPPRRPFFGRIKDRVKPLLELLAS